MTDEIMDKLPDEELSEEEHEALLLRSEHAIALPLSPAAQAVMDAARKYKTQAFSDATHQRFNLGIVAALRALANHNTPAWGGTGPACHWMPTPRTRQELLNIADELENV